MFGKKDQDLLAEAYGKVIEGKQNEEEFHPGGGMVPAPIGPDTVTGKGLKKLWGIKMRAGKWADTFIGQYDLPDGKNFGIIDSEGVTRYASVDLFNAAFKKLRRETIQTELHERTQNEIEGKMDLVDGQKVKVKTVNSFGPVEKGIVFDATWEKVYGMPGQWRLDIDFKDSYALRHPSIFYHELNKGKEYLSIDSRWELL
jgi:hypothetical protein